jgi:hypothetical protein
MQTEITRCASCRCEVEHFYDESLTVVKVTPCNCAKVELKKPLDKAFKKIDQILNIRRYNNGKAKPLSKNKPNPKANYLYSKER